MKHFLTRKNTSREPYHNSMHCSSTHSFDSNEVVTSGRNAQTDIDWDQLCNNARQMNTPLVQWTIWIVFQNGVPLPRVINGLDLIVNPIGGAGVVYMCATVCQSLPHPVPQWFGDDNIKKIFVPLKSRFFIVGTPSSKRNSQRQQKDQTNRENIR